MTDPASTVTNPPPTEPRRTLTTAERALLDMAAARLTHLVDELDG